MSVDQSTPRRAFLAQLSLGTAGVAGYGAARGSAASVPSDFNLETATVAEFAQRVGSRVRVIGEAGEFQEMKLIRADDLSGSAASDPRAGARRAFSITLRGPKDPILPQRTYEIEHRDLGRFYLFLVPSNSDRTGTDYVAVFN